MNLKMITLFFFSKISNWYFSYISSISSLKLSTLPFIVKVFTVVCLQHFYNRMLKVFVRPFQHLCCLF